jgi:hypothetical protein
VSGHKELRAALPPGYRFRPARKHLLVEDPDGNLVRFPDGRPLAVCKGGRPKRTTVAHVLGQIKELTG